VSWDRRTVNRPKLHGWQFCSLSAPEVLARTCALSVKTKRVQPGEVMLAAGDRMTHKMSGERTLSASRRRFSLFQAWKEGSRVSGLASVSGGGETGGLTGVIALKTQGLTSSGLHEAPPLPSPRSLSSAACVSGRSYHAQPKPSPFWKG